MAALGYFCTKFEHVFWVTLLNTAVLHGVSYDERYRVGPDGAMGITISPEELSSIPTQPSYTRPYGMNPAETNFQKVYMDFIRSQMPTKSRYSQYSADNYATANGYSQYDDFDSDTYSSYESNDIGDSPPSKRRGIKDAAKELTSDTPKKSPKTLSTKCALEGGFCSPFKGCNTDSHIYKGYCATDYSSVCCVPRRTVCEANDGICTDDREACVAAGEIMGRKYNLKFYTWMDCNTTHVCCRPSQVFSSPFQNAQKEIEEKVDDATETEEEEEEYSPLRTRKRKQVSRKRKSEIGKVVANPKGFQDAVNPDFAGYPDESPNSGRRTKGRIRGPGGAPGVRGRPGVIPRTRLLPPYAVPYQSVPSQHPAVPGSTQYLASNAYASNRYPSLMDYMSAYANANPSGAVKGKAYTAAFPDQSALVSSNSIPVQSGGYPVQSQSAAQPSSLFGNIFL